MEPLFKLPNAVLELLKDVPTDIYSSLNIDAYEIASLPIKQLHLQISQNIKTKVGGIENLDRSTKRLYFYCLFIAEEFQLIYDQSSRLQDVEELFWYFVAGYYVEGSKGTNEFTMPDVEFNPTSNIDKFITSFIQKFSIHKRDPGKFTEELEILFDNKHLILQNILTVGILVSTGTALRQANLDYSLELQSMINELLEKFNFKRIYGYSQNQLGSYHVWQYDYESAEEHMTKSVEIAKEFDSERIDGYEGNLALVYFQQGDLDRAISIYERQISEGNNLVIALYNLSTIYRMKGDYEKAVEYARRKQEIDPNTDVFHFFTEHIALLELGRVEEAKDLITKIEKLVEENPAPSNIDTLRIVHARQKYHTSNFADAFKLFDEYIAYCFEMGYINELVNVSIEKIQKQLEIIDLLSKFNPDAKSDLMYDVTSLLTFCDEQGIVLGSIETLLLRAKIHHAYNNLDDAKKDTYNAHKLAHKYELAELEEEILEYRNEKLSVVDKTDEKSIWSSIKQGMTRMINRTFGGKMTKEEFEIHGVLILGQSGIPLYDRYFTSRLESEPALVSGLIAAVSSFMTELSKGSGFLKAISHDDLSLVLEKVRNFVIVSIVDRETYEIRLKTKRYGNEIDTVLEKYGIENHPGEVSRELDNSLRQVTETIFNS